LHVPKVKLFGNLRKLAFASTLDQPGVTVQAVIRGLCARNELLCNAILDGEGLRPQIRVALNGHDIELAQGLDTPVNPGDTIAIFPPIAGGG
jgi:molybdopterin synthase sulfur carrier subunit